MASCTDMGVTGNRLVRTTRAPPTSATTGLRLTRRRPYKSPTAQSPWTARSC